MTDEENFRDFMWDKTCAEAALKRYSIKVKIKDIKKGKPMPIDDKEVENVEMDGLSVQGS